VNGDLLDLVFEENEVVFRDDIGFKVGERRKTTTILGNQRRVEYIDKFGHSKGYAVEVTSIADNPHVEFYDKNGNLVGKAYVTSTWNGRREIRYTNKDGDTISTRYVDEKAVARNNVTSMETSEHVTKEDTGRVTIRGGGGGGGGVGTDVGIGPIIICGIIYILICGMLDKAFGESLTAAYQSPYEVLRVVRFLCLYVPIPLVLIITAILVHVPKTAKPEVMIFRFWQLVFTIPAMLATVLILDRVLLFWGNTIDGWDGFWLYLAGYVPAAVYSLLSRIRVSFKKRNGDDWDDYDSIALCYVNTAVIVSTFAVFLARLTMAFIIKFDYAASIYFFARAGWHILVALFFGAMIRSIYRDVFDA